ncbi:hypothetical protein SDC9_07990 [bioreactor metagenome]|uniref:ATP-grasp domain-containing protein n=1 Tax=bioreactor metagenome TaxID=1076179 RepID=A0A644T685_9ZZZZ|nr:hypothetical protein [Candidatus Elulimicrobiales bacterium]
MLERRKTIAIIRGGIDDYSRSMRNGANIIISLSRYQDLIEVIDVVLDEQNNWFERGIPSDAHKVFSKADFYIDLTSNKNADYHALAQKLDVKPIFRDNHISAPNRVNSRRILNQIGVSVPRYILIRDIQSLKPGLEEAWNRFQTPLVVKEVRHDFNHKSIITYSFLEAFDKAKQILKFGGEVLLEEHVDGRYVSVAAIPNYRGENIYIPTPAEIINLKGDKMIRNRLVREKYLVDHVCDKKCLIHAEESLKKEIRKTVEEIYKTFLFENQALVDLAIIEKKTPNRHGKHSHEYSIKVLDVHTSPNLFEDSRLDFILKSSGIDMGQFILEKMDKIEEEELIY